MGHGEAYGNARGAGDISPALKLERSMNERQRSPPRMSKGQEAQVWSDIMRQSRTTFSTDVNSSSVSFDGFLVSNEVERFRVLQAT